MVKYIVAPAVGTVADEPVIACALGVATTFGAHIDFVHVRIDVARVVAAASTSGSAVLAGSIDAMETDETASEGRALANVTRLCEAAGVPLHPTSAAGDGCSADFAVETGAEAEWLAEYGRFADLIVLGRRRDGTGSGIDVLETALLDSSRPVLIAPAVAAPTLTGTVVIAWSDTPEALRAVHAAMAFIARAERVVVLCVDSDPAHEPATERLQRALRWHNAKTTIRHEPAGSGDLVETLLQIAKALEASLLVMGGYSHSPLRELLFGGATHSILAGAELPVLMAH